jgi:hypothetical protein
MSYFFILRINQVLISVRVLPSGSAVLYYMFDA